MKRFTLTAALLVSALGIGAAQTQTSVFVGYTTNGTTIKILNATDDNSLIGPVIDGQQNRYLTPRGTFFKRHYENGLGINNGPTKIDWEVFGCRNEHQVLAGTFYNPPPWSSDESYLPNLALTRAYLGSNPNEDAVIARVNAIIDLLNERRELGRGDKIKELKLWFKSIKKTGLTDREQVCANAQIITGTLTVADWYGHDTILTTVRGGAATGFTYTIQ